MPTVNVKIDWTKDDTIEYTDFNRIENNIIAVYNYLRDVALMSMPAITSLIDRTMISYDNLVSINRIESNIDLLRSKITTPPGYGDKVTWTVEKTFDFNQANRLELNLKLLSDYATFVVNSYRYCGVTVCGGDNLIYG